MINKRMTAVILKVTDNICFVKGTEICYCCYLYCTCINVTMHYLVQLYNLMFVCMLNNECIDMKSE